MRRLLSRGDSSKNTDAAGLWLMQSQNELDQGGFAAAVRSDNADRLLAQKG